MELETNPTEKRNIKFAYNSQGEKVGKVWEVWRVDTNTKCTTYYKNLSTGAVLTGAEHCIKRFKLREE